MKTLVYIGVNKGYGLSRLLQNNQFDIVYAWHVLQKLNFLLYS